MELEKIKRVEETNSVEILNLYLDKGWILIAAASPQGNLTNYTVAWKENVEPLYPEFIRAWRNKELNSELYEHFPFDEGMAYYFYSKYQES